MTPPKDKPRAREWWLKKDDKYHNQEFTNENPHLKDPKLWGDFKDSIHVIEMSAFLELKDENERLKEEIKALEVYEKHWNKRILNER